MREKTNSPIHLRPRFSLDVKQKPEELINKFKKALTEGNKRYPSRFVDGHIIIDVPKKDDHFWSPQLNIEVVASETDKEKSIVKGLFGPKPQVWTLFMFIHFVVGIAFLIFAVMLYVKWSLEEVYVLPLMMVIFLPILWTVLYFLGRIGKSTGHTQMDDLHDLMINILNN